MPWSCASPGPLDDLPTIKKCCASGNGEVTGHLDSKEVSQCTHYIIYIYISLP